MELTELIFVPLVLFVVIVLPMWLVFHYVTLWKRERRQKRDDKFSYRDLQDLAGKLESRLDAVESILDHDEPGWRNKT